MSIDDLKLSESEIALYGVAAAPDKLSGTAQENKELFDRLIRECLAEKFNGLVALLQGQVEDMEFFLPIASPDTLGGVKIGAGLSIDADGVLSATGGGDLPNGDEVSY